MLCDGCVTFVNSYFNDFEKNVWRRFVPPQHQVFAVTEPCEICVLLLGFTKGLERIVVISLATINTPYFPGPMLTIKDPNNSDACLNFEFYTPGQYQPPSSCERLRRDLKDGVPNLRQVPLQGYVNPDLLQPNNPACFDIINQWMDDCRTHPFCRPSPSDRLPKRLVDVTFDPPRLIETTLQQRAAYIVLSCPWIENGFAPLVSENLDIYLQQLPITSRSKTLNDAILIAQSLEIRYLWIFDLCIIQDNDEDWKDEVSRLPSIMSNALFTISISPISCFRRTGVYPALNDFNNEGIVLAPSPIAEVPDLGIRLFQEPLTEHQSEDFVRGWHIVERLLSTAVLHYAPHEMAWECRSGLQSQSWRFWPTTTNDHLPSWPFRTNFKLQNVAELLRNPGPEKAWQYWREVVIMLSSPSFVIPQDRLVAAHYVSKLFEPIFQASTSLHGIIRFVAGFWTYNLSKDLCWIREHIEEEQGLALLRGTIPSHLQIPSIRPSWSWVSTDGPVFLDSPDYSPEFVSRITLIEGPEQIDPEFYRYTAEIPVLHLSGKLIRASTLRKILAPQEKLQVKARQKQMVIQLPPGQTGFMVDEELKLIYCWDGVPLLTQQQFLLLVAEDEHDLWLLVLAEQEQGNGVNAGFARVGVCFTKHQLNIKDYQVDLLRGLFETAKARSVKLV
jgi:hypothetical protein